MNTQVQDSSPRVPWNKGKLAGQKAPLRISEIQAIRVRLNPRACSRPGAL